MGSAQCLPHRARLPCVRGVHIDTAQHALLERPKCTVSNHLVLVALSTQTLSMRRYMRGAQVLHPIVVPLLELQRSNPRLRLSCAPNELLPIQLDGTSMNKVGAPLQDAGQGTCVRPYLRTMDQRGAIHNKRPHFPQTTLLSVKSFPSGSLVQKRAPTAPVR